MTVLRFSPRGTRSVKTPRAPNNRNGEVRVIKVYCTGYDIGKEQQLETREEFAFIHGSPSGDIQCMRRRFDNYDDAASAARKYADDCDAAYVP
jgi:hypothetical protein